MSKVCASNMCDVGSMDINAVTAMTVTERIHGIVDTLGEALDVVHKTIGPLPENKSCDKPEFVTQMGEILSELRQADYLATRVLQQIRRISEAL